MTAGAALTIDYRATRTEAFEDAWADAQHDTTDALAVWRTALVSARADAYAAYRAALEREECAAITLRRARETQ